LLTYSELLKAYDVCLLFSVIQEKLFKSLIRNLKYHKAKSGTFLVSTSFCSVFSFKPLSKFCTSSLECADRFSSL